MSVTRNWRQLKLRNNICRICGCTANWTCGVIADSFNTLGTRHYCEECKPFASRTCGYPFQQLPSASSVIKSFRRAERLNKAADPRAGDRGHRINPKLRYGQSQDDFNYKD